MKAKSGFTKFLYILLGAGLVVFILMQLVPYGKNHENPPATNPVQWSDPQAEEIARRACYDCHSNESIWPWYANVAPASWLLQMDVEKGRRFLNFSTGEGVDLDEISEVLQEDYMPPARYLLLHPDARLSQADKDMLINGLP